MAADPRVTGYLDTFDRADEDPLSNGGKWALSGLTGTGYLELISDAATHQNGGPSGDMYWTPRTFEGDEIEVWGNPDGGNASGLAWALGLYQSPGSAAVDGYRARQETSSGGGSIQLYRVTNGATTNIGSGGADPGFTAGDSQTFFCLRRIDATNTLQVWYVKASDPTNWVKAIEVVDSTYTGAFYLACGIRDNSASQVLGWSGIGGGSPSSKTPLPQIIRRTHRRGGFWHP